jgi:hypothetical protein
VYPTTLPAPMSGPTNDDGSQEDKVCALTNPNLPYHWKAIEKGGVWGRFGGREVVVGTGKR